MAQGTPLTRRCPTCGETKRLSQFHENRTKPDHRNGICKSCQAAVDRRTRERNKEARAAGEPKKGIWARVFGR